MVLIPYLFSPTFISMFIFCQERLRTEKYKVTRISGPDGPLILAVDLRNTPKGGGYGRTDAPTHCFIYIDEKYFIVHPQIFMSCELYCSVAE